MAGEDDDPTRWLGDPIASHDTAAGEIYIHVPPAGRDVVVVSILDAASPFDDGPVDNNAYVRVNLEGALNLQRGLSAAIAQLQEHAGGGRPDG